MLAIRLLLLSALLVLGAPRALAQPELEAETIVAIEGMVVEEAGEDVVEAPSLSALTVPTAPQRPRVLPPQPLGRVEIRYWPFDHAIHDGHHVYVHPEIRPLYVERALRAIARSHAMVPAMMGRGPTEVEYYIFPYQLMMRSGLSWIGRIPQRDVMQESGGVAFQDEGHHVTFMHADLFEDEMEGTWVVAHELTHHLAHQLHGGSDAVPAWLEEGNAEIVAARVVQQLFPDEFAQDAFFRTSRIVNAARQSALPSLGPLTENAAWITANNEDRNNLLYDTSWLMTEWLLSLRNPAAPATVMELVGQGRPFAEAFAEVFGMPVEEIDRGFLAHVTGPLAARYPVGMSTQRSSVPANQRAYLVFTGLRPNESVRLEYRSPECRGESSLNANPLGYALFWIGEIPDHCVGTYTIQMTGSQGTAGSLELTFTPATGPVTAPTR